MGSDRVLQSVVAGVAAGLVAAWVMNRFQSAIDAAGLGPRHDGVPSNVIAADRLGKMLTGAPLSTRGQAAAGAAVHYAFGAVLGALYAVARRGGFRPGFTPMAWCRTGSSAPRSKRRCGRSPMRRGDGEGARRSRVPERSGPLCGYALATRRHGEAR